MDAFLTDANFMCREKPARWRHFGEPGPR